MSSERDFINLFWILSVLHDALCPSFGFFGTGYGSKVFFLIIDSTTWKAITVLLLSQSEKLVHHFLWDVLHTEHEILCPVLDVVKNISLLSDLVTSERFICTVLHMLSATWQSMTVPECFNA